MTNMTLHLRFAWVYVFLVHFTDAARDILNRPVASHLEQESQANVTFSIEPKQTTTCSGIRNDCTSLAGLRKGCHSGRKCCNCTKTTDAYMSTGLEWDLKTFPVHHSRFDSGWIAKCAKVKLFPSCEGTHKKL